MGLSRPVTFLLAAGLLLSSCGGTRAPDNVPVYDLKLAGRSAGAAVVSPGDTLGGIANRYGLTLPDIIRANMLDGRDGLIAPYQRLNLPPPRTYIVQPLDTLRRVARMFDVEPEGLAENNNMAVDAPLVPGQVLRVAGAPRIVPSRGAVQQPVGAIRLDVVTSERLEAPPQGAQKQAAAMRQTPPKQTQPVKKPKAVTKTAAVKSGRFARPLEGQVVSAYGPKNGGLFNEGINIAAKAGTPVGAADSGTVVFAGEGPDGFGKLVLLRHDDDYFTVYSHLSRVRVTEGASVARGQDIGAVGATGKVREPQLHFEIRKGTEARDPAGYM